MYYYYYEVKQMCENLRAAAQEKAPLGIGAAEGFHEFRV